MSIVVRAAVEAVRGTDNDAHVRPTHSQTDATIVTALGVDHAASAFCWCQPVLAYEDVVTRGRVYRHKRES